MDQLQLSLQSMEWIHVWTVCSDLQDSGRIPSIESLKAIDPRTESSVEVILIDRRGDATLKELQNRIHSVSCNCNTTKEVVDQLANLICNRMGGATFSGEGDLLAIWKECSDDLKDCIGSVVLPTGSLSIGLYRHRAVLVQLFIRELIRIEGCFPVMCNLYLNNNYLTGGIPTQLANLANLKLFCQDLFRKTILQPGPPVDFALQIVLEVIKPQSWILLLNGDVFIQQQVEDGEKLTRLCVFYNS